MHFLIQANNIYEFKNTVESMFDKEYITLLLRESESSFSPRIYFIHFMIWTYLSTFLYSFPGKPHGLAESLKRNSKTIRLSLY